MKTLILAGLLCGHFQTEVWKLENRTVNSLAPNCVFVSPRLGPFTNGVGWRGGASRLANVSDFYRIDHFDWCTGAAEGSSYKTITHDQTFFFNIHNPNLEGSDSATYIRHDAPLADDEVQAAFLEAQENCTNFDLNSAEPSR